MQITLVALNFTAVILKRKKKKNPGVWWLTPLVLALCGQRNADLCDFMARLVHIVSPRASRAIY